MKTNQLSKLISYALRHEPQEFGLNPDSQGWVKISDLLDGIHRYSVEYAGVSLNDLHSMVSTAKKQRHEIQGDMIRALYGHSAQTVQTVDRAPAIPSAVLYHGTSLESWECIKAEGLKPMTRQHVHLTESKEDAIAVGRRHSTEVVLLEVDTAAASSAGIAFYPSGSKVWLADSVPAQFITEAF